MMPSVHRLIPEIEHSPELRSTRINPHGQQWQPILRLPAETVVVAVVELLGPSLYNIEYWVQRFVMMNVSILMYCLRL